MILLADGSNLNKCKLIICEVLGWRIIEVNLETLGWKLPCKLRLINLSQNPAKINHSLTTDVLTVMMMNISNVQMIHNRLDAPPVATALLLKTSQRLN